MLYTFPDYYKKFHCIADACEETCCAGWQIVLDEHAIERYKKALKHHPKMALQINWMEGIFRQNQDRRCAFLNEQNLCDMYTSLGEKSLCRTCRLYPRHIEEFEDVREVTLSVSCPEVARILMEKREPVHFLEFERDRAEREESYQDYDPFIYSLLADTRDEMIRILQNRDMDLKLRSMLCLVLAHDVQVKINHGEVFGGEDVIERYQRAEAIAYTRRYLMEALADEQKICDFSREMYHHLYELEHLNKEWKDRLTVSERLIYGQGQDDYVQKRKDFTAWLDIHMPAFPIQCEQLLVYFISTYYCGAVYDGRGFAKVQFAAVSVMLIEELLRAEWLSQDKNLTEQDVIRMVYRYSREVEHSDDNMQLMEKLMERGRVF